MSKRKDILIVEDDRDFSNTLRVMFESKGYDVRCAYDGKAGMDEIVRQKPDGMVLDVMMGTLTDGFDLACNLKAKPEYERIPIVMVTGFPHEMAKIGTDKFQSILGEEWPVAKFLEKPVDPERIVAAVEALLEK